MKFEIIASKKLDFPEDFQNFGWGGFIYVGRFPTSRDSNKIYT